MKSFTFLLLTRVLNCFSGDRCGPLASCFRTEILVFLGVFIVHIYVQIEYDFSAECEQSTDVRLSLFGVFWKVVFENYFVKWQDLVYSVMCGEIPVCLFCLYVYSIMFTFVYFLLRVEVCNPPPPFPHQLDNLMTRYKKCCKRIHIFWFFLSKANITKL